jgi:hypothetical protein
MHSVPVRKPDEKRPFGDHDVIGRIILRWIEGRVYKGFWRGNLRLSYHWGDPDVHGMIILKIVEGRDVQRILVGKPEGKKHWGDPHVDGRINLKMDEWQRCSQGSGV